MSWYAERPATLAACVDGIANVGADHLVCVDGPYEGFPDSTPRSTPDQYDILHVSAEANGLPLTLHTPSHPWAGETGKRSFLFNLAHAHATPYDDWLLVVDADEQLDPTNHAHLRDQLTTTHHDVATLTLHSTGDERAPGTIRRLFRAHPLGIKVGPEHGDYTRGDGTLLMGMPRGHEAQALHTTITGVHAPHARTGLRLRNRTAYYLTRRQERIEG